MRGGVQTPRVLQACLGGGSLSCRQEGGSKVPQANSSGLHFRKSVDGKKEAVTVLWELQPWWREGGALCPTQRTVIR